MNSKQVTIAFLFALVLLLVAFAPLSGQVGTYDPWFDLNDDGKIDGKDIARVAKGFGTLGTPIIKAAIDYDSDWINITDEAGQYISVIHNLNSADVMVDITGKTTANGGIHQRYLGGADFVAGWNKTYGGTGVDPPTGLVQTVDGGYALIGQTESFGAGSYDFWLVKTDASGNMLWNKTYGGTGFEQAEALVQTADGGYALAGQTGWASAADFWLVKTDAYGNQQWNKTYGGGNGDFAHDLMQTADGGYTLAGMTGWGGNVDLLLLKTDADGNQQWSKTYGGTGSDWANDLVQTGDGGYVLSCGTTSSGAGGVDAWMVKTDASGNMLWNKTYGGTGEETTFNAVRTGDGGYVLLAVTTSFGAGGYDIWLVKTDASGNMQWNKTYGRTNNENGNFLAQTGDGGYAIAGYTRSYGAGDSDFYLMKTDASGNMLWNKTYGGTDYDVAWGLVQTADGGYALVGETNSYGAGSGDFWLVKTDAAGNALDGFKYGLAWVGSTPNTIELYRGTDDAYWNYVRIRIWKVKETP